MRSKNLSRTLKKLNEQVKTLVEKIEEDIETTRSIQRALIPKKFPQPQGLKVLHRYLAGEKSGGDYLDVFEFEDKNRVGVLMSKSNGYGLSSAFMSILLRLAVRMSSDGTAPSRSIERVMSELKLTMKLDDQLSLFYGILDRRTLIFSYINNGNIELRYVASGEKLQNGLQDSILKKNHPFILNDHSLSLMPKDRLVIFSEGFKKASRKVNFQAHDSLEIVNAMTYPIKAKLKEKGEMPAQDCSLLVLDIESVAIQLARKESSAI